MQSNRFLKTKWLLNLTNLNQLLFTKVVKQANSFQQENCVKSIQIQSYFWSVFSCIRTEYGEIKCPNTELFLVRIQSEHGKIRTRNNSVFGHFSRSGSNIVEVTSSVKLLEIHIDTSLVSTCILVTFVNLLPSNLMLLWD